MTIRYGLWLWLRNKCGSESSKNTDDFRAKISFLFVIMYIEQDEKI